MKVYFVRHGECETNARGVIAGGRDNSPLTDKGREDAELTAQRLNGIDFDYVISSPLDRTYDTAKIIVDRLGIDKEIIVEPGFTERDAGSATGMVRFMGMADKVDDSEPIDTMYERIKQAIERLEGLSASTVLVISHSGAIKVARTVLAGLPPDDFRAMPNLENGDFFEVELDDIEVKNG